MTDLNSYESPLTSRYASREMSYFFSPQFKYSTWRKLWVAQAIAQKALGLPITNEQIQSMKAMIDKIDFDAVEAQEKLCHHDVMAHILAFGEQCPEARKIIHLGSTSCFVTDNTDLLQIQAALILLRTKLVQASKALSDFAQKHASLACLSYTHFQAAQPTTVGKRACLWLQDLLLDLSAFEHALEYLHFLGAKGATGTQASYLSLFNGDHGKVLELEKRIAKAMGFKKIFPISGQTYTRKQDIQIMGALASFAASTHKFATDLRLLAHLREVEEPFKETQVGSSAMPHKRNPMRAERLCSLARFLISLQENPLYTEATQWFERTLDDSANRRLYIPQAFLTADAILNILCPLIPALVVNPKIIEAHLKEELPFLASESLLMEAVKQGKDRQTVHDRLRFHCLNAANQMKTEGKKVDLFTLFEEDKEIGLSKTEIEQLCKAESFVGRAVEQTHAFLTDSAAPTLKKYASSSASQFEASV